MTRIYLPDVVGGGYGEFWRSHRRYLVVKGSRGSKKSTTAALKMIYRIMQQPKTNGLVVRRYYAGLRDSCFAQLRWAIDRLGVRAYWHATMAPLQLTYLPTGQVILFRGMDDPQSLTSITVPEGYLNLCWIEECYQIDDEHAFDKLDMSIRGERDSGYYNQLMLTFNPWNENHWLKARFFDRPDDDVLAMTTTYQCNEWLNPADRALFDKMRTRWPRRYAVEGLGEWGVSEGLIYTDWETMRFDVPSLLRQRDQRGDPQVRAYYGMDFGFAQDPTAGVELLVDQEHQRIYVSDEIYGTGMTNEDIYRALVDHGWVSRRIVADSAEPRTINELRRLGAERMVGAQKGPDSIRAGIQRLQDWHIVVHVDCENVIRELSNYQWKTERATGRQLPRPLENGNDHAMDAMRYATEGLSGDSFSFEDSRGVAAWAL